MYVLDRLRMKSDPRDGRSPEEILKSIVGNVNKLPMMPAAATKAMAVANNPASALRDFAGVIERDPALTTGILKLANSPLYRIGRTIESLDQAVVRLGLRECKNLIVAVGMRSLLRAVSPAKRKQCEVLWRHSFVTACLCRRLNHALGLGFQGEEFSCGLSHDLGRMLIAIGAPEHFDAADPMDFEENGDPLGREQSVLGTDHCYFGAWFANLNQLPGSLATTIQHHHAPADAGDLQPLVGLVSLADHMANHLQRGERGEYDLTANPGWQVLSPACDDAIKEQFGELAPAMMEEAQEEAQEVVTVAAT
jgi:HD-like signal output (HDOD) protein